METAHLILLAAGMLGLVSIIASIAASRFEAPLLLVFLGIGLLVGRGGIGGIVFSDFQTAYFLGSLALAIILFNGGLKTERAYVQAALWPSVALATVGVAITAAAISVVARLLFALTWPKALLIGAAVAPTDAAAVATLLKAGAVKLPPRVAAILEVESGLNDPVSVFLMIFGVTIVMGTEAMTPVHAVLLVVREMAGGAVLGVLGGCGLLWLLKRLDTEPGIFPVLALAGTLTIFGGAQLLETSGFLAIYIAGYIVGNHVHRHPQPVQEFFETFAWVAQIGLFLLLGILVSPQDLLHAVMPALVVSICLIFIARPVATFLCLWPFRIPVRDMSFISWVGLRGAVPIFLTIIPVLAGLPRGNLLFDLVFVVVVTSLIVQGWTVGRVARWLKFPSA